MNELTNAETLAANEYIRAQFATIYPRATIHVHAYDDETIHVHVDDIEFTMSITSDDELYEFFHDEIAVSFMIPTD